MAANTPEHRRYVDLTVSALAGFATPRFIEGPPIAAGYVRVPVSDAFISMDELKACVSEADLEAAEAARQTYLKSRRAEGRSQFELYKTLRSAVVRRAEAEGLALPADAFADMFRAAALTQESEARNIGFAAAQAGKSAVAQSDNRLFVLMDTGAGAEVVAQTSEGAPSDEARMAWYFDMGQEFLFGLLGLAGGIPKAGADVPKLWRELMLRDKIKKAFALVIATGFDLSDIITFVKTLFEEDDIVEQLLTVLDCGFWAIVWCIAKWGAKMTPGVGQALLAGAVALLAGKLCIKLIDGPKAVT